MQRAVLYCWLVIMALMLTGCSSQTDWPDATRTEPPPIPAYPRVLGTEQRIEQLRRKMKEHVITFQTEDDPATVLDFYDQQLRGPSWRSPFRDDTTFEKSEWSACPLYHVHITTTPTISGTTDVMIDVAPGACIDL